MSYPNNNNQGASQRGGGKAPKEPIINNGDWTGIVRTRYPGDDQIRFSPLKSKPGGYIHFSLEIIDNFRNEETGQEGNSTTFVPMSAKTNKNLTQEFLSSICPGMRIHVKGKLKNESYTGRDGQHRSTLVVQAYAIDILENQQQYGPQAGFGAQVPGYGPQGQQYPPQYPQAPGYAQPYQPQQGAYAQYAQQVPGYVPQGMPQQPPQGGYPQPQYPQAPAYGPQPGYTQYPQQGAQRPQPSAPQGQGWQGGAPPQYQQGAPAQQPYRSQGPQQQGAPQGPVPGQGAPAPADADMPDFGNDNMPIHDINV